MSGLLHLAEDGEDERLFSRFVSLLGTTIVAAGTFRPVPGTDLATAWRDWVEGTFRPVLAPAFIEAFDHALAERIVELKEVDLLVEKSLSSEIAEASRAAARGFLDGKDEMRANRGWRRYAAAIEAQEAPGHLVIVFALQAALFHLSLGAALEAYAWFEFRSRRGPGVPPRADEAEQAIFAVILPEVAVAVGRESGDPSGASGLRSV